MCYVFCVRILAHIKLYSKSNKLSNRKLLNKLITRNEKWLITFNEYILLINDVKNASLRNIIRIEIM